MIEELLLATHNAHKVEEIRAVLKGIRVLSMTDLGDLEELPETRKTLEENAMQKARTAYARHRRPCVADDSGLEVDALGGAPGVNSAHYAGPQRNDADNIRLLLEKMSGAKSRTAQFRTVMALVSDEGEHFFEGRAEGVIAHIRRGKHGFGYDPVFIPAGFNRSFAEMSAAEKNAMSHRSKAVAALLEFLAKS